MRAVDTNVLIYAEIRSSPHHDAARSLLTDLSEGSFPWAIPWPCVYEFLRVVTHPRVYHPPVPLIVALEDLERVFESPGLHLLHETENHGSLTMRIMRDAGVTGNLIHDAHIAALCLEHGITELITADRDFSRFSQHLKIWDPFR